MKENAVIDLFGVVTDVGSINPVASTTKRSFSLMDHTGKINIYVWGINAEKIENIIKVGDKVLVKGGQVNIYMDNISINLRRIMIEKIQHGSFFEEKLVAFDNLLKRIYQKDIDHVNMLSLSYMNKQIFIKGNTKIINNINWDLIKNDKHNKKATVKLNMEEFSFFFFFFVVFVF